MMTFREISEKIKAEGYTLEVFNLLDETIKNGNWESYKDPDIMYFFKTITELDYNQEIQNVIGKLVDKMYEKGIQPPCMSGCDPECPFKEIE